MRRRARVFGRVGRRLFREIGREAFVEGDNGNVRHVAESLDEPVGLACLLAAFAAQGEWKPDDDAVDLVLTDQRSKPGETVPGRSLFDDAERPCDGAGRVRDRNSGSRAAVVVDTLW